MAHYLVRRLLQVIPVLFGVTIVAFLLVRLIPGGPAIAMLGSRATPELVARVNSEMGLDLPVWQQYFAYISKVVTGDFGISFFYQEDVLPIVLERVPLTLTLITYSAIIALTLAIPLATIAATRRGGKVDQAIRVLFTATLGIPSFWLAIMLVLVLGVQLRLFPIAGPGKGGIDTLWHLTLPALTIALSISAILARSLRSSLIEVFGSDYVLTGKAAGLRSRTMLSSYTLRNSLLPLVTVLALNVGWVISATVIIEQVYGLPGLGSLLITSITTRDYAIIQLVTLVLAVFVILVNLATDLAYAALDPRVTLR